MDLIPPAPEPTELTVMLKVVDEFSKSRAGQHEKAVKEITQQTFKNVARELLSKYNNKIITRLELFTEAAASGRRIYFEALNGETNVTA